MSLSKCFCGRKAFFERIRTNGKTLTMRIASFNINGIKGHNNV